MRCRDPGMHFVIYTLVPGPSIRELGGCEPSADEILGRLAVYLAKLHQNGVYFKALHLGNIIVQRDGSFALIDFHSTKFYRMPVSVNKRLKNLKNMLHYAQDYALLECYGLDPFIREYLQSSGMTSTQKNAFLKAFKATFPN
jgi:tRNA A-37 threonylcarbamoyl transferase component Bud32